MDIATIVGFVVGLTTVFVVMVMDGGSPAELFAHPSAILLIIGGSLSATIITVPLKVAMQLPKYLIQAFTTKNFDSKATIDLLTKLADRARRDGLLALEEDSKKIKDKFLQKGIMMVVDGVDAEQVEAILDSNIEQMRTRHKAGIGFFASAGGFAPTFGIIGTVMGLISVLKQLDNPSALGESIAAAFLATLWGLLMANLVYLPVSGKLKAKSEEEARNRYMQMEGILAIQAGENPRVVRDKLNAYLAPAEVKNADEKGAAPAGRAEKAQA
ncbi:MAG TPA: motility protein A [Anaerolineales bacterium]|nr:motility protein A [Anaerolineales bacterium]